MPGISATGGNPIAVTTASVNQFLLIDVRPGDPGAENTSFSPQREVASFAAEGMRLLSTVAGPEIEQKVQSLLEHISRSETASYQQMLLNIGGMMPGTVFHHGNLPGCCLWTAQDLQCVQVAEVKR